MSYPPTNRRGDDHWGILVMFLVVVLLPLATYYTHNGG